MVKASDIAKEAFDAVALDIADAIQDCTLRQVVRGAYDVATNSYSESASTYTGRLVVITERPENLFEGHVVGPQDQILFIEGLGVTPSKNDTISYSSVVDAPIVATQDILAAGTLFYAIARVG